MGILDQSGGIDPQTAGLLAAAFQGLQASGPSRTPQGLGQVIGQAGQAGLETYGQTRLANLKAGLTSLQLQKLQADIDLQKNFAASGLLKDMSNADRLESLGTQMAALGHAGGASLISRAEQIRKRKSEEDTLATFRSKDGEGGLFSPLLESPYVGGAAKQLQQTLDTTKGSGISPAVFTQRFDALQKEHLAQMSQNPNVHVVEDKASPTGWSYKDMRTGRQLSTGAPPPANVPLGMMNVVPPEHQNLHGEEYLKTLSPSLASNVKGVAEGRIDIRSMSYRGGNREAMMQMASQYDPELNLQNYGVRLAAEKGFTSGKQGNTVRSFNVAINHLGTLDKTVDALGNGDVKLFNKLSQRYSEETGNPAPTNFDGVKKIVADEITKAIIGSRGALGDREKAAESLSRANSPEQLKGVMSQYKDLMAGQLQGFEKQYEAATMKKDFRTKFLTPETQKQLTNKGAPSTQEGTKNISKSGKPIVFRNGNWEYE